MLTIILMHWEMDGILTMRMLSNRSILICFKKLIAHYFFSISMKTWQNFQSFQYPRGFGSASASPFSIGGVPRIIYSMGKSREGMYSIVESIDQPLTGLRQQGFGQPATSIFHSIIILLIAIEFFIWLCFSNA